MTKINTYCFSPTGGTLQVARHLSAHLGRLLQVGVEIHSYTLPHEREHLPQISADDIVVWATPVYAGRVPNKTLDYVRRSLHGCGNPAVALVTFGNRAYDNALAELVGLMEEGGMNPVGAAAVVSRHSFSDTLGAGRPDACDIVALDHFAEHVAERIRAHRFARLTVPGNARPEQYYSPLKVDNTPAGFLKAKPVCVHDRCTCCGKCFGVCPMGSIGRDGAYPSFDGICIKCQACRTTCPVGAIAFTDPDYLSHVAMIERTFAARKQSEFYLSE